MSDVDLQELAIDRSGSPQARVRPGRHLLSRYLLPAVLLVGFAALVLWASQDYLFPPQPVTVILVEATQEVQTEGTPLFNAAGWIEPRPTSVRAAALAPGVVEELLVVEDQPVKAGEPIAELVKEDAQLAYERALADQKLREAESSEATAALAAAVTRYRQPVHLEAALGAADAQLAKIETELRNLPFETRRAEARLAFAKSDYEGKLASQGTVAGRAIDAAKSDLEAATALVEELHGRKKSLQKEQGALIDRRDALKTQLELLADEIEARDEAKAKLGGATARVEQARVAVEEAKLRLDRMTIRSPIDGRVYQLIGHPGASIGNGLTQMEGYDSSTVVTLYRPDSLQVRVDVRFEDLPDVSVGQPVRIANEALPSPIPGQVLFRSSGADIQKNTLEVKVGIDSPPFVFKPEMLVDVTFLAPARAAESTEPAATMHLFVPARLLKEDDAGKFLWVADQSAGVARRTTVAVGVSRADGFVEITSGLNISSRLIVTGSDNLTDGARIRVTGDEPSPVLQHITAQPGGKNTSTPDNVSQPSTGENP